MKFWPTLKDAFRIAWPYWFSTDKWWARGLLAVVIALNLGQVGLNVVFSYWNNAFFNTLQNFDQPGFFQQLLVFSGLASAFIIAGICRTYFSQMLRIRWRRWLTDVYLGRWLKDRAYFQMQLGAERTDNPDQRVAEDLRDFADSTLSLSLGLLSSVVSFFSFVAVLWSLSGPITLPLGFLGEITIPAYMVWLAVAYAAVGTWITTKISRPLVKLNFNQQRFEADFRFGLMRLRENTESVAFYRGEERERSILTDRFREVFNNFLGIMRRQAVYNAFAFGYGQAAVVFPYILQAPRYFAKQIQLGDLMQTAQAFNQVQESLSYIINVYPDLANWQSVVQRLATFDSHIDAVAARAAQPGGVVISSAGDSVTARDLSLTLPHGKPLLSGIALSAEPGATLLITGPTGAGKSTLLRAIAGLWPFARGSVTLPAGRSFFVPQQPYLSLGTLRQALAYPDDGRGHSDAEMGAVLLKVGLGALAPELNASDHWSQRLSPGEQQRIAFARVLLARPAAVFLDEATSALDEESEAQLYALLRAAPWHPTIVSVGHRSTLRRFHDSELSLARQGDAQPIAATTLP
ncbi:MAG: ABC transporter ATP-binding protein/permease [Alphaproteobacteria bacterium]|nr:ABC transporter ATP-binding protein/permease [Alphaproteobacteria bacterium]